MEQYDFARNWRKRISPLLEKPDVVRALHIGMMLQSDDYRPGNPPWLHGRGPLNGQRAKKGCLSWYQPWGRCHFIAPFSWALGRELFPELSWGFITSDAHTVAIGYDSQWEAPELVLDILLFRENTAQESLDFAKANGWRYYRTMSRYASSFFNDPEEVHGQYAAMLGD